MKKAIIVDIDGTISNNVTGRPWFGKGAAEGMLKDEAYINIIDLIKSYAYCYDYDILILTGRHKGEEQKATEHWLHNNYMPYNRLFTRDPRDFSKTSTYKEKVYEEQIKPYYDIVMVFEDNNSCVQMFRSKGLTVMQPQNSDY